MAFDKKEYWKNRKDGKRGQGEEKKPVVVPNTDGNVEMGFDENGRLVAKTRAWKRSTVKLRTKHLGIPPRKLAEHRKKQAARKRREARALKKERANG